MRRLGIDTEDVPKFGREFRKSRDLDRKTEREKIDNRVKKEYKKEEDEPVDGDKVEKEKKKKKKEIRYGRYAI